MKHQSGCIVKDKKRRCWFGRWYDDVVRCAQCRKPEPKHRIGDHAFSPAIMHILVTQKLADISDRYRTETDVRPLLDDKLRLLNEGRVNPLSTMTLAQFVDSHYLPGYVEGELKPSTQDGYRKLWQQLKPQVGNLIVRDVTPKHIYELLRKLRSAGLGRRSLYHTKGLLSGIFAYAVSTGLLSHNPVRDAKMVKTDAPKQTHAASLGEVLDILDALKGKPKARAAIALMYFAGLRPGEARGVRWEDYGPEYDHESGTWQWRLTPRQSVWRTKIGTPKTEDSTKPVPVIEPLRVILSELRLAEDNPQTGPILRGERDGKPLNLANLARRVIIPALEACKCGKHRCGHDDDSDHAYEARIVWRGYYTLRRGIGTRVTAETKDALAAKGLLRHSNVATTQQHYILDVPENTRRAMLVIEQQTLALMAKRADGNSSPALCSKNAASQAAAEIPPA